MVTSPTMVMGGDISKLRIQHIEMVREDKGVWGGRTYQILCIPKT